MRGRPRRSLRRVTLSAEVELASNRRARTVRPPDEAIGDGSCPATVIVYGGSHRYVADGSREATEMAADRNRPSLPPRWFVRTAWVAHRALYNLSGGRLGLRRERSDRWGMLRLHVVGRRTGKQRQVILAYAEDGPNLVLIAMNGWADPPPAWWLNLRAHPAARVDLPSGPRDVLAHEATPEERVRLWGLLTSQWKDLDAYASLRSRETPVIILEPRPA